MTHPFYTIGHSDRSLEAFGALLVTAGVQQLVDVRKMPRSRANPQFNGDTLADALAPLGIGYAYAAPLGGLRGRDATVPASINGYWSNRSFHNYADYALSAPFRTGLEQLVEDGRPVTCAVMCAESVWWRCHRRIIADYLLAAGEQVIHVLGPGSETPGSLSEGAVPENGLLTYPEPLSPAPEAESHRSSRAAFSRT